MYDPMKNLSKYKGDIFKNKACYFTEIVPVQVEKIDIPYIRHFAFHMVSHFKKVMKSNSRYIINTQFH